MFKINTTPALTATIDRLKETKQRLDAAKLEHDMAKQAVLNDPMLASAAKIELERVNEAGTTLTGTVEVYDSNMTKLLTVSNVGWKMGFSQSLAMEHLATHPGARAYMKETVKLDTRAFLKAAQVNEHIAEEIGITYDEATPSLKIG